VSLTSTIGIVFASKLFFGSATEFWKRTTSGNLPFSKAGFLRGKDNFEQRTAFYRWHLIFD
jgi:hypothetical protein